MTEEQTKKKKVKLLDLINTLTDPGHLPAAVRDEIRIAEEQSIIEINLMRKKQKKKIPPPQKN